MPFSSGAVAGFNVGVAAQDDDPVDGADEVVGELFLGVVGDVHPDLEQDVGGQFVDRGSGSVPAESTVTVSPAIFRMSPAEI